MITTMLGVLGCQPDCTHPLDEYCASNPAECAEFLPMDETREEVLDSRHANWRLYDCGAYVEVRELNARHPFFYNHFYDAVSGRLVGYQFSWDVGRCSIEAYGLVPECGSTTISSGGTSFWDTGAAQTSATGGTGGSPATGDTGRQ